MKNIEQETRFLIKKYHICANKNLGQNFLINTDVIENIIDMADIQKDDLVIEIGPGLGVLTNELLQRAGKVIAVELDLNMITILKDRFSLFSNFEVIHEDILKIDLKEVIQKEQIGQIKKVKIVANLPYYITTPIIMKLLEDKLDIDSITVMVQKEVAERLIATPGEKLSGAITYTVYYYATSERGLIVPNTSFIPSPEVESEVIHLKIRKNPPILLKDEKVFFQVVKASFMQRRKTLMNGLLHGGIFSSKEEIICMYERLGIDEKIRGECLTMEQFASIANDIVEHRK